MRVFRFKTQLLQRLVVGFLLVLAVLLFVGITSGPIAEITGSPKDVRLGPEPESHAEHQKHVDTAAREVSRPESPVDYLNEQKQKLSHNLEFVSFDESAPKSLIILTYQRSGSSLVGDMFSRNPDAFYLFEPLDAAYVAMYGINHGWSVPSDITHYWNGTHRQIPEEEIKIVADYLDHLLTCEIGWLPTEALTHNFWRVHRHHMTNLNDYIECINGANLTYPTCEETNPWSCGHRFGEVDDIQNTNCRRTLWNARYGGSAITNTQREQHAGSRYADYFRCLNSVRLRIDKHCAPLLQSACNRSPLRVVKATRSTMRSVGELLDRRSAAGDRNTRVVHAYRDPRAVAASRHRQGDPLLGKHAAFVVDTDPNESIVREARMYCRTAVDDFRFRNDELDRHYPGVITSLDFDRAVQDVVATVSDIYSSAAAAKPPADVVRWAEVVAANSRKLSSGWRAHMSMAMSDRILALDECEELCRYIECR